MVAILILLELTLQCKKASLFDTIGCGRNPYFIGINSAISAFDDGKCHNEMVAILILLELTLQ